MPMSDKCWKPFSLFIRLRDCIEFSDKIGDGMLPYAPCVSCGKVLHYKHLDAGHFLPRGYRIYEYDERNVHAQCGNCNAFKQGNYAGYREFMIEKYGEDCVKGMEELKKVLIHRTSLDIEALAIYYKAEVKKFKKILGVV